MTKKKTFLSNPGNKQAFLDLRADHFRQVGFRMVQCKDDADVTIAITSIDLSKAGNRVLLWGDDTDLLAIVLHHLSEMNREEEPRIWFNRPSFDSTIDLTTLSKDMDPLLLALILPLHVFSGCETKSSFYEMGKNTFVPAVATETDRGPGMADYLHRFRCLSGRSLQSRQKAHYQHVCITSQTNSASPWKSFSGCKARYTPMLVTCITKHSSGISVSLLILFSQYLPELWPYNNSPVFYTKFNVGWQIIASIRKTLAGRSLLWVTCFRTQDMSKLVLAVLLYRVAVLQGVKKTVGTVAARYSYLVTIPVRAPRGASTTLTMLWKSQSRLRNNMTSKRM